jgi:L-amino acid N-acyltransferase YncA
MQPAMASGIRAATHADAEAIAEIYNPFVRDTIVTFEEEEISGDEVIQRLELIERAGLPWFVAEDGEGKILGYAYAGLWHRRSACRYTAEGSVYLSDMARGQGLGEALYRAVIEACREAGMKNLIGGIALPNDRSVALHEKLGFTKTAHYPAVALKFGQWIDIGYWLLVL